MVRETPNLLHPSSGGHGPHDLSVRLHMHPIRKAFAHLRCPSCAGPIEVTRPHVFDRAIANTGLEVILGVLFLIFAALLSRWTGTLWVFALAVMAFYPFAILIHRYLSGFHCRSCSRGFTFGEVDGVGWTIYPVRAG